MKNFSLKLTAGFFAVLLFFLVNNRNNATVISLFVPVKIDNLPENKTIIYPRVKQAMVTFQGPSFKLSEVASSAPVFRVELPDDIDSRYNIVLSQNLLNIPIPRSIEVLSIEPGDMEITLDNIVKKTVPVEVARLGKLNENFKLVDIESSPSKVEISGPQTELMNVNRIVTYPVDLRTIQEDLQLELDLRSPGTLSRSAISQVSVSVKVLSLNIKRTFKNLLVEIRSLSQGNFTLEPKSVDLTVSGPKAIVKKLRREEIVPFSRIAGEMDNHSKIDVSVDLPEGVSLVSVVPNRVSVVQSIE